MRYGLCIGGDAVVLERGKVDMFGVEAAQNRFDFVEGCIGCTVFDENLCVVSR